MKYNLGPYGPGNLNILRLMDDCLKIVTIVTRGNDIKLLLQLLYELRHNLKQISYEANISDLKDGGIGILMRANR